MKVVQQNSGMVILSVNTFNKYFEKLITIIDNSNNENMESNDQNNLENYAKRVWIQGGIYALIVIILLLLKATFSVLLLVLAAVLIAVFFRGLSNLIARKTKMPEKWALSISIIGSLSILVLLILLIGSKVQSQAQQLTETLPATVQTAKAKLNETTVGQTIVERLESPETRQKAKKFAETFFRSTFGVLGDIYVILFIGIFFTVNPQLYKKGIIALIPKGGKDQGKDVLDETGNNLQKWLKGKIFAMVVVFILTAIGLTIIGVPLWLVLAIIAGLLNFIPNFGPLMAMIPAVLVGLLQGTTTALIIAGLYILIQFVESNFITPLVQQKLIDTPPAMIIIIQLLVGALTGGWGLVLATPLFVVGMTMVQELYVKKQG